jgi:hypothetical protein
VNEKVSNEFDDPGAIVTINRKMQVYWYLTGVFVLGCLVFVGTFTWFGGRGLANVNRLMLCLLGTFVSGICMVAFVWIRERWICVAVLDENGIIASTIAKKYDLQWSDLIGARTYAKYSKDTNLPKVRLLLLVDEDRGLESPVPLSQINTLYQILGNATFKLDCEGQRLGTIQGSTLFILGTIAFLLGLWWDTILLGQFNDGKLFQGNGKIILLKLATGIAGPIGGLGCAVWALYHVVARPILYVPGWITSKK